MRRNKPILFLLLVCLLLSACAGPAVSVPSEEVEIQESSAPSLPSAAELSPSPEPTPEEPTPFPESPSPVPEAYTGPLGIFPLLVTEEISLDLIITRNPLLHQVEMCLFWMIPEDREDYEISDIRINDSLRFDESLSISRENKAFLDLGPLIAEGLFSWDDLHSFHCRVLKTVWSKEDRRSIPVWEAECEVTIPQDFQPDFVFLPCLGAHAEKQLLCDDENMHITLLGLGRPAWSGGGTFGSLLRVENRSAETRPFKVTGLSVNGSSVDFYEGNSFTLQPGTVGYSYFYSYVNSFSDNDITAIHEVSLLLLTDDADDTGTMYRAGGRWYSVDLISENRDEGRPESPEVFFENEWVRIGILDYVDDGSYNGVKHYTWHLFVENLSETDLELFCYRPEDYENYSLIRDDEPYYYLSEREIRAGGWRYTDLCLSVPEGMDPPDLWVRFMGQSFGGGRLLFLEEEPVLVPAGTEAQDAG